MTVGEMIEQLQGLPEYADLKIWSWYAGDWRKEYVQSVEIDEEEQDAVIIR